MEKNSFTLFETLISIILLSIIISGFIYSAYYDKQNSNIFTILNSLENNFNTKDYSKFLKSQEQVKIIINKDEESTLLVNKYTYEDENIKVFKYEK